MKLLILITSIFSTTVYARGSKPPSVEQPSFRKPKSDAKVYYARDNFQIRSVSDIPKIGKVSGSNPTVWDLQGAILDGSKQSGDGSQNEDQEPLIRVRMSLIIKNGFVRKNKNAMTFYSPNSGIDKLTFTDIGEDAVATTPGAYRMRVTNSEFLNDRDGDKSIQLNEAKDALVEGNMVYSGITCMRIGATGVTTTSDRATVKNNRWIGCRTAIHGAHLTIYESGSQYIGVSEQKVGPGAVYR